MSKKGNPEAQLTTTERLLSEISMKLDRMTRLSCIIALKDLETDKEKIELLDQMGLPPAEIGRMLNKKTNVITGALFRIRAKEGKDAAIETSGEPESPALAKIGSSFENLQATEVVEEKKAN